MLKETERKWEEGLVSVFQLMEARNRLLVAKAEKIRVGAGIGMSLVAIILEHHNAVLSVESEPGCGTTMRILLPW